MQRITEKNCIDYLKQKFPKFVPYWNSFVDYWGIDQGLTIQMLPLCEYTIDTIKSNDELEIKKIFDLVEFLICNGKETALR